MRELKTDIILTLILETLQRIEFLMDHVITQAEIAAEAEAEAENEDI